MFVKIMSGEGIPDGDNRKQFRLFANVVHVDFFRNANNAATADIQFASGEHAVFELLGNAYVLNDAGKSIEAFGVSEYPKDAAEKRGSKKH